MLSIDPGPFTVLIAEDEPLIRMNAIACVEEAGYIAVAVATAADALEVMHDNENIDALFTDIQMPGAMSGLDLAHDVHRRWPMLPLLIVSGRESPSEEDMPERARFLAKPYTAEQVARLLDEMLLGFDVSPVLLGTVRG